MSSYRPKYKTDDAGTIVDLPLDAATLNGYSYEQYTKYYKTASATANAFTVSIPNVTALEDGMIIHCQFNAATASGATLNVNNLGAKGIYYRYATAITTHIAANNYVDLIYASAIDKFVMLFSYDSNTNTIAYQVRTNSAIFTNKTGYSMNRYTILCEVNGGLSGFATTIATGTTKTTVSPKYIPGGVIKYYSTSGAIANNANFGATGLWDRYTLDLRYTFNIGTTVISSGKPVYIRMSKNTDGTLSPHYAYTSPGKHPIATALPTTADGDVYVYLGKAYSTSSIELDMCHPMYEFVGGKIQVYTGVTIPTKTSDLTNDSNFVVDASYVHTDNNFTTAYKNAVDANSAKVSNVQADWNATTGLAVILNKPTIPTVDYPVTDVKVNNTSVVSNKIASITVPTKVSDLQNDSGYLTTITSTDVINALGYTPGTSNLTIGTTSATAAAGNHAHGNITNTGTITSTAVTSATGVLVYDSSNKIQRATAANARSIIGAQATLVSGTNIKTINNESILGSGNISIGGGGGSLKIHYITINVYDEDDDEGDSYNDDYYSFLLPSTTITSAITNVTTLKTALQNAGANSSYRPLPATKFHESTQSSSFTAIGIYVSANHVNLISKDDVAHDTEHWEHINITDIVIG